MTVQSTEISYSPHRLGSSPQPLWLPDEAVVTIGYRGSTFRNTHRYSDYKLFSVQSFERIEPIAARQ